jgi:hypothetical protein
VRRERLYKRLHAETEKNRALEREEATIAPPNAPYVGETATLKLRAPRQDWRQHNHEGPECSDHNVYHVAYVVSEYGCAQHIGGLSKTCASCSRIWRA